MLGKYRLQRLKERSYNLDFKNPHAQEEDYGDPQELLEKLILAENEAASLREQLKEKLMDALLR